MGSTKNVDMSATQDTVKIVPTIEETAEATQADTQASAVKKGRVRSHRYVAARSQVDKTKLYDAVSALELVKRLSYSKFDGTVEAHLVLKDIGTTATITFPHTTGKSRTVVIANDAVLADLEAGKIEFDILVASPDMMPKLTKYARVLGPKGLMPNPKMGTLSPNPEKAKEQLEAGSLTLKTEKKAPLMHVTIGKVSQDTKNLAENLEILMKEFKGKLVRVSVSATMSPGVKVQISE